MSLSGKESDIAMKITVIDNASPKIKTIKTEIQSLDKDLSNVTGTSAKLDAGLKAFSWTTFGAGALNVSTSIAQVVTSISNLDRIQLQVKNSMVGVERAEDLLTKKTMMLNKEIEKNGSLSEKSIRLTNEIATATQDLSNKQEKLKIAQGDVNEVYLLFASNVANTVFGTMQTLGAMYLMLAQRKIADTALTVANAGATKLNNTIRGESILLQQIQWLEGAKVTATNITQTASTLSLTVAMRGLAASVMANPLFLPATLATIALGIGVTVHQLNEMGKVSREAAGNIQGLGTGVNLTTGEMSEFSTVLTSANTDMVTYSSSIEDTRIKIDELTKSIDELQKKQNESNKFGTQVSAMGKIVDYGKPIAGQSNEKSKLENELKVLEEAQKQRAATWNAFITGNMKLANETDIKSINLIISNVSSLADIYDTVTDSHDDYVESLDRALAKQIESGILNKEQADYVRQRLIDQKDYNKESDKEISNSQKLVQLYKEIVNLQKKKTSQHYIIAQDKEIFKNFELGEYGLSDSFVDRILGKSRNGDLGYMPFSGYINSKSKQVIYESQLINTANNLSMYYAQLEQLVQIIPTDENKQLIIEAMQDVRNNIERERIGGNNFVGVGMRHPIALSAAKQVSQSINDIIRSYRSMKTPSFSGATAYDKKFLDKIQHASLSYNSLTGESTASSFSVGKIIRNKDGTFTRTGEGITTRVVGGGTQSSINPRASSLGGKLNYSPASTSKFTTLTKSRSTGSKGRNASASAQMEQTRLAALGGMDPYYLGLTGISTTVGYELYSYAAGQKTTRYLWDDFHKRVSEASTRINLGKQILALGEFDPDASGNIFTNTSSQLTSMLQREQAQIIHQSALIGETTQDIIRLRNSPEPEFYDRIRYSERLEQISTGATVF